MRTSAMLFVGTTELTLMTLSEYSLRRSLASLMVVGEVDVAAGEDGMVFSVHEGADALDLKLTSCKVFFE